MGVMHCGFVKKRKYTPVSELTPEQQAAIREKKRLFMKNSYYPKYKNTLGAWRKGRSAKIREFLLGVKRSSPCYICGESHVAALDFHHVDSSAKEFTISRMASQCLSQKKIEAEVAKCKVICSNCHRKLHYEDGTWSDNL